MNDIKIEPIEPVVDPVVRHKFELEDKEFDTTWKSCCITLDKRATIYFTQITIIVLVMVFSIYQLLSLSSCDSQQALGLLTMLIGLIIPNPKLQN